MSLLMDALKKAEQAKHNEVGAEAPSSLATPEESPVPSEDKTTAIDTQQQADIFSLDLTLDETELPSKPEPVQTAITVDVPAPQAELQDKSESDEILLPEDRSRSAVEQQKRVQESAPISKSLPTPIEPRVESPASRESTIAEQKPAAVNNPVPTPDPQQLQRSFVLKARAANKRKRLVVISLGSVILLLLLGGGYYYFDNALSSIGNASLVTSTSSVSLEPEQDAEFAETVMDEAMLPASSVQSTQIDSSVSSFRVLAPLEPTAVVEQTAPATQLIPLPASRLPAHNDNERAPVRKPKLADSSQTAPVRPVKADRIRIKRAHKTDPFHQRLLAAYHAYQAGNYTLASSNYHDVLKQDASNRDALLGLGTIAQRNGDREQAAGYYLTLIKQNPKDSTAISGLMSLQGAGLTIENESRIKMLLDQEPGAAHLHFVLGTVYAAQSRWADAQQSFFNAHRYAPQNADYVFNLAVSLDRMSKQAPALEYYRRAVRLASGQQAMFNLSAANERIKALLSLTSPIQ
jgi:tetratricopeptide (TPR) repeat protein